MPPATATTKHDLVIADSTNTTAYLEGTRCTDPPPVKVYVDRQGGLVIWVNWYNPDPKKPWADPDQSWDIIRVPKKDVDNLFAGQNVPAPEHQAEAAR